MDPLSLSVMTAAVKGRSGSGNTTVISLVGLGENMEKALGLSEKHLSSLIPDEDILTEMKGDLFRSRSDSKTNQRAIASALRTYLMYGP